MFFEIIEIRFVEQVADWGFVGKRDAEDLERFVNTAFNLDVVMHDCHEAVSSYCTIYLYAHSVFACTPKLLDLQVLLDPFEEQLNAPSVTIKPRNHRCRRVQIVGQKDILFFVSASIHTTRRSLSG